MSGFRTQLWVNCLTFQSLKEHPQMIHKQQPEEDKCLGVSSLDFILILKMMFLLNHP